MKVIIDNLWETTPSQRTDKAQTGFGINGLYYSTPAFEYNMYMNIIYNFKQHFASTCTSYGLYNNGNDVQIVTEYPRDLKDLHMPTIVVRQVTTDEKDITSGGMLGVKKTSEGSVEVEFELFFRERTMHVQFDLCCATKKDRLLLKSLTSDTLLDMAREPMKNYLNPQKTTMKLDETIKNECDGYTRNITHDDIQYLSVVRNTFSAKEFFVPYPELVDLADITLIQYLEEITENSKMVVEV